jgi:ABC-type amino acid transport substrate-binding protein
MPKERRVAVLWNPAFSERSSANFRFWSSDWVEVRAAAQVLDMTIQSVEIRGADFKADVVTFPDHPPGLLALEQGRIVAYVGDGIVLAGLAAKTRSPKDYEVVGDFFSKDPYSCMVPENDSKWRDFVNHAFMELIDSGKFFELYDKWFGERGVVP